jgi:Cu(I)-responsive transcriptional regulator
MNISDASRASGLSAKTIRYYEEVGLVPQPERRTNGYRDYGTEELRLLEFVKRARGLGFSLAECKQLTELYQNPQRRSRNVRQLTTAKLAQIDRKIDELMTIRRELSALADACRGDDGADCPILDAIDGAAEEA